jgi:hypothetical protein
MRGRSIGRLVARRLYATRPVSRPACTQPAYARRTLRCTLSPMRPAPSHTGGSRNCASRRTTSHCASGSTWQRGAGIGPRLLGAARPSAPSSVAFTGWSATTCSCRTTVGRCGACLRRGTQICARPDPRRLTWLILGSA